MADLGEGAEETSLQVSQSVAAGKCEEIIEVCRVGRPKTQCRA